MFTSRKQNAGQNRNVKG